MKFNYKNKQYRLGIYKAKNVIGFGLWFGYKFSNLGYSSIYIKEGFFRTIDCSRTLSFYFPFFVFALYLHTAILTKDVCLKKHIIIYRRKKILIEKR